MSIDWRKFGRKLWREWIKPIGLIVLVVGAVRSSLATWYDVPTGSMEPSILPGDRVFVNKLAYDLRFPFTGWRIAQWGQPRRGDVVVFPSPKDGTRLVKRIVAVGGDEIELRQNRLMINGETARYAPLEGSFVELITDGRNHEFAREEWIGAAGTKGARTGAGHPIMLTPGVDFVKSFGPVRVPQGMVFAMGDNRDQSGDSRIFGFVDADDVVGRATTVVWSLNGLSPRWARFFQRLP